MRVNSLMNWIFGFLIFATTYKGRVTASSYMFRRVTQRHTLKTDKELESTLDFDTVLPKEFIEKLKSNIKKLEKMDTSKELVPTAKIVENKEKQNSRTSKKRTQIRKQLVTIHSILTAPTNVMRAHLRAKTGLFLRMSKSGELSGTWNMGDAHTIFIIERMSKDAVRLKGEAAQKYICITKKQKVVTRERPMLKCLLRNYLEENYYELFWSYLYSDKTDGENGWFLALRGNGKIKKPSRTKIGDKQTMFYVNRVNDAYSKAKT